jgi:hypothetical protein
MAGSAQLTAVCALLTLSVSGLVYVDAADAEMVTLAAVDFDEV